MIDNINALIIKIYKQVGTLDPFTVAEYMGIDIRYVPFLDNPYGQSLNIMGDPIILIADHLKESNHRYFVLAHEIYHSLQHSDLSGYYVRDSVTRGKLENEANKFAVAYYMQKYVEDYGISPYSYTELTNLYGVPLGIIECYA